MGAAAWLMNLGFAGGTSPAVLGPYVVEACEIYRPGMVAGEVYRPGAVEREVFQPGLVAGEIVGGGDT